MAKKGKLPAPKDPSAALEGLERPGIKWKPIGSIVGAFVILWVTALMTVPWIDYWGVGVVGVLTLVAIGFGIYVFRMTRRSQGIVDILSQAKDEEGRQRALEQLEKADPKDALAALARAQLVAQKNPADAIEVLEGIDVDKAPAVVQDDVRANLALLYLTQGRAKDARRLADHIRLDRQPNAKAKGLYAAVASEAFARTGKADEAKKLLETYDPEDAAYGEARPLLLRAQVYTFMATKNSGLAQQAMQRLAKADPNALAAFLGKGARPELQKMAKKALRSQGMEPRQKTRMQRRM